MSPKVKKELESALVTFISTFVMTLAPLVMAHYDTAGTIEWSVFASLAATALRAGIKTVYTLLINDYTEHGSERSGT